MKLVLGERGAGIDRHSSWGAQIKRLVSNYKVTCHRASQHHYIHSRRQLFDLVRCTNPAKAALSDDFEELEISRASTENTTILR